MQRGSQLGVSIFVTGDFIIVGPQAAPEGSGSLFVIFRWHGYRVDAQGYREIDSITTAHIDAKFAVLSPEAAKRQLPYLTTWIESVIDHEDV